MQPLRRRRRPRSAAPALSFLLAPFVLAAAAALPGQALAFQVEQHPAGGCLSQALTIMHLEPAPSACPAGQLLTITVRDTVPGEDVLLCFGDSRPWLGASYLPVFTHGPYLVGPEYFGPWCGWFTNGGVWGCARATANATAFAVRLPPVPSPALVGEFLWCQAVMSDPTPGWRQRYVTSRPVRLRVVAA